MQTTAFTRKHGRGAALLLGLALPFQLALFTPLIPSLMIPLLIPSPASAQSFNAGEYRKALWMATRFYGGQRSGAGPNWLIMEHKSGKDFVQDADGAHSLAGGWHDCGDHVKYGQTQFYSGYMLLKAYAEFPAGFDDHYGFDYSGYKSSGDFTWEGGKGGPNGIPDLLDEVKYAADYFIRCARSETEFYNQVGDGALDHKNWVTSVHMATLSPQEGGQVRKVYKNPSDASMPSFCAASLGLMSRLYRKFDPAFADLCLVHARYAYAYAKAHPGTEGTKDGGFYPANARWQDDFVIAGTELHRTTGEPAFLEDAKRLAGSVAEHNFSLCYNNNDDLAAYNLAVTGLADKAGLLQKMVDRYKANVTSAGVGATGDGWGRLRFPMNQAFAAALAAKLKGTAAVDPF
ncbi:MAG: glycoside hydrolase family 9 protein, partial [Fibrobacterota bacterium]|nr:glycoside hydrolase family 9 protein [Fibrobacterota bacterium]